jgi:hypothetical protein
MIRGRFKQLAVAMGASALVAAAGLAVVPAVASAAGSQTTATAVTAKPLATTSGHPLTLTAKVTAVTGLASTHRASTPNAGTPTGTVTFIITGTPTGTIHCKTSDVVTITHKGKAVCKVLAGQLQAMDSPYNVQAVYSGDTNFAASTGNTSVTVTKAKTTTKLKIDSAPHNGTANSVTATVRTKHGGSLLTGSVLFSVSATPATGPGKRMCTNGGNSQPLAVTGNVGTAVCDLQPGWFIISKMTPANKHPHGSWNVTANYSGDGNFTTSLGNKSGHSRS